MKFNRYISKWISLFLIVLLMQKAGGNLFLHDWLHAQSKTCTSHDQPAVAESIANCTCIDDFYSPFADIPDRIIQPVPLINTEFITPASLPIPFSVQIFHSLRGPPFSIS
jgi:hypothetical protein